MNRFSTELDLSPCIGKLTTQIRVGKFDLQFSIGTVHFAIQSLTELEKDGAIIGSWDENRWPDPAFLEIINSTVVGYQIANDRLLLIDFENKIRLRLNDNSDKYECMSISIEGQSGTWYI
jgi:hypothetical protein